MIDMVTNEFDKINLNFTILSQTLSPHCLLYYVNFVKIVV